MTKKGWRIGKKRSVKIRDMSKEKILKSAMSEIIIRT